MPLAFSNGGVLVATAKPAQRPGEEDADARREVLLRHTPLPRAATLALLDDEAEAVCGRGRSTAAAQARESYATVAATSHVTLVNRATHQSTRLLVAAFVPAGE